MNDCENTANSGLLKCAFTLSSGLDHKSNEFLPRNLLHLPPCSKMCSKSQEHSIKCSRFWERIPWICERNKRNARLINTDLPFHSLGRRSRLNSLLLRSVNPCTSDRLRNRLYWVANNSIRFGYDILRCVKRFMQHLHQIPSHFQRGDKSLYHLRPETNETDFFFQTMPMSTTTKPDKDTR